MVSFTLDVVKFLLIYRHLQNTYWFKCDNVFVGKFPMLKNVFLHKDTKKNLYV